MAIQTALDSISNSSGSPFGFKNRIINGAMVIDQRNAGASVTPTSTATYTLDRWAALLSVSSKFSVQQNAGSVTPPAGFKNYLGATSLSAYSVGASEIFSLRQTIEGFNIADLGWGAAGAATVTLSFWVRSSLTGTFGGALNSPSNSYSYPFTYSISSANTWEQKTVTIAGPTAGTWGSTNGNGIAIIFNLGAGATFSGTAGAWVASDLYSATGSVSVVGTSGATFYITGVQLEKGSTATSFDYRPYGTELALCQRYFFRKDFNAASESVAVIQAYAAGAAFGKLCDLPVTMRATPVGSLSAIGSFRPNSAAGNAQAAFTAGAIDYVGTNQLGTTGFSGSSGLSAGSATVIVTNAAAWIAASAEL